MSKFFWSFSIGLFFFSIPQLFAGAISDSLQQEYMQQQIEPKKFSEEDWNNATKDLDYTDRRTKEEERKEKAAVMLPQIPQSIILTFFAVIFAILILIILRAFGIHIFLKRKLKRDKEFQLENFSNEIPESELEKWLHEALAENNFRLAVRIYYLIIIKELSNRNWISWRKEKTNHDYLRELKNSDCISDFKMVTGIFERIWYGERNIDGLGYEKLSKTFSSLLQQIKKSS